MSESQSQSYKPAPVAAKRVSPVLVWAVILLVAIGAFSAAVVMAGGVSGVADLVGLGGLLGGSSPAAGGQGRPAASAPASATPNASTLPTEALAAMYAEQLESQPYITELAEGNITSMKLGTPVVSGQSADIPVTVTSNSGSVVNGGFTLKRYNGTWYFVSVHSPSKPDAPAGVHTAFDSSVVGVITQSQATSGTQELIKDGLLGGGYKVVSPAGIVSGPGTKTLSVDLTGGREAPEHGRFVLIQKVEGPNSYWFIARFEKTK